MEIPTGRLSSIVDEKSAWIEDFHIPYVILVHDVAQEDRSYMDNLMLRFRGDRLRTISLIQMPISNLDFVAAMPLLQTLDITDCRFIGSASARNLRLLDDLREIRVGGTQLNARDLITYVSPTIQYLDAFSIPFNLEEAEAVTFRFPNLIVRLISMSEYKKFQKPYFNNQSRRKQT